MTQDGRLELLRQWLYTIEGWEDASCEPASADASFRRYFRVYRGMTSAIVMDAPPDKEDLAPFIDVNTRLRNAGVNTPRISAQNLLDGYLLMDDLGSTPLLSALEPSTARLYYRQAMAELIKLQGADADHLPLYDNDLLFKEMGLMPEWFLKTHLNFSADELPNELIDSTLTLLATEVASQPVTFVHRDYHSRNLMLTANDDIGVIDFQDAVLGPITYDLVSLLRDCYISWPDSRVKRWALTFHKEAISNGTIPPSDEHTFLRWFDLTGLQRHLKVLGIFCRLSHRDGKNGYLNDLPLVLSYVLKVGARHPETSHLVEWFKRAGIPERIGTVTLLD